MEWMKEYKAAYYIMARPHKKGGAIFNTLIRSSLSSTREKKTDHITDNMTVAWMN